MFAACWLLVQVAAPRLELVAAQRVADPIALAVDDTGTRIFSVEGATVVELERAKERFVERRRWVLDAPAAELVASGTRLYVAGATRGAGVLELEQPEPAVSWLDAPSGATCTSIAVAGATIAATFAALERSTLRVWRDGARGASVDTPLPGLALDVALGDGVAYVALGPAGVARVELGAPSEARLGPPLPREHVSTKHRLGAPWARDLAVSGDRLYVAADVAGLVEIELGGAWPTARTRVVPLALANTPAYAIRVAADGARIAVGTTRGPAQACDGAPYGLFGTLGWDLSVGGVDFASFELGASEGLWIFERAQGELIQRVSQPLEHSGWRSLVLRGSSVFEQHLRTGLAVRELASPADAPWSTRVLATRKPRGIPSIDGAPSLVDPRLVLFGIDSAGSIGRGLLRFGENGEFAFARGLGDTPPLGLGVGAQWRDADPRREWFVSNGLLAWRLNRLTHGSEPRLETWELSPPPPPDLAAGGSKGNSYLNSALAGSLVLVTRYGSRVGLLAYGRDELVAATKRVAAGGELALEPRWQVATHASDETAPCFTWNTCVFELADGRRLAAVAAGANAKAGGEHEDRPQVALFALANDDGAPQSLGSLHGIGAKGQAIAAQHCVLGGRDKLVVTSTGGELLVFDVAEPERAKLERTLMTPRHPYDGTRDAVLDVELWPRAEDSVVAWVAAGRSGLLAAELRPGTAQAQELSLVDDTPGWAAGLATTILDGRRHLLLGDQRAGLRLYR